VDFAPDSHRLLSGGGDDTMRLWELKGGRRVQQEVQRFGPHQKGLLLVGFLADDQRVFSLDGAETTRNWEVGSGDIKYTFKIAGLAPGSPPLVPVLSPDRRRLAFGSSLSFVENDLATGQPSPMQSAQFAVVTSIAYSPDGRRALTGSRDAFVRLWDLERKVEIDRYPGHKDAVHGVTFTGDGQQMLSVGLDRKLGLWDPKESAPRKLLDLEGGLPPDLTAVAFAPDRKLVACSGGKGHVILWDVATGKRRSAWQMPGAVYHVAWAADCRHLATANANGTVYVYRLDTSGAEPPPR
jgi:WD40 repeat protein